MSGGGGGLKMGGGVAYYSEVFLEIPLDAVQKKNIDLYIFLLLANMWYKIIA